MRSRVFGLVTVGIGCWPIGTLLAGLIAEVLSPAGALLALGLAGLVGNGLLTHRTMCCSSRR
ncbi:hypothetical protein AWB74_08055 [Caballeronia arvi]|uniref:Uncharacterized protein n=1 Tax=Caballeronia arvi TaxID=1777135 RepID=A0A158L2P9_9BURK|nr:hypothetical protein AWB74_08055 [Caballeronia arvi]